MKDKLKLCRVCKNEFYDETAQAVYCSARCRSTATKVVTKESHLCPAKRGAVHELIVSVDLMKRGFEVFRNLSPVGKIDLIAYANGKTLRVQVKKGLIDQKGDRIAAKPKGQGEAWDIWAVSYEDGMIAYTPPLPEL